MSWWGWLFWFIYFQVGLGMAVGFGNHDYDGFNTRLGILLCFVFWPVVWGYFFIKGNA